MAIEEPSAAADIIKGADQTKQSHPKVDNVTSHALHMDNADVVIKCQLYYTEASFYLRGKIQLLTSSTLITTYFELRSSFETKNFEKILAKTMKFLKNR